MVKYEFCALPACATRARALREEDDPAWRAFFRALHAGADDDGWMREYFCEMAESGLAFGVFEAGALACATDLPGMPYLAGRVREIGIATLPEFRGRGFARDACVSAAREMIARGICPLWSAGAENSASRRLAESVGFLEFADAYALTL